MAKSFKEVNFDCLPGPSHHFGGLALGNIASQQSKGQASNPKAAALQALEKAWFVAQQGIKQVIMPPHPRPIAGNYASAFMWAANSATALTESDASQLTLLPANMSTSKHRAAEHQQHSKIFKQLLPSANILPPSANPDEGAANHMLLTPRHGVAGINIFVYGFNSKVKSTNSPKKHPPRQSKAAWQAMLAKTNIENSFLLKQNAEAIDKGVFHNDVIATANENVLLVHEKAFEFTASSIEALRNKYKTMFGIMPVIIEVSSTQLSLEEAVATYLFNSQILTLPDGKMLLLCAQQVHDSASAKAVVEQIVADSSNPIAEAKYMDLSQSMANGGGPACLRLRVVLDGAQLAYIKDSSNTLLTSELYADLKNWIEQHYLENLTEQDLKNSKFTQKFDEDNNIALQKLEEIMRLQIL